MLRRSIRTQITKRVLVLSTTVAVLLGATLVLLIIAVTGQRDAARIAFASQEALTLTSRLQTSLFAIENDLRDYVRKPTRPLEPVTNRLAAFPVQQRALAAQLSDDRGQRERVREVGAMIKSYAIRANALIIVARTRPKVARNQLFYTDRRDLIAALSASLRNLASRERTIVRRREDDAEAQSAAAIAFGIGGLGLVLIVVVAGTLYLRRAVVRPVVRVARATGRIAAGDLDTRVPADRADEIGELARGFNTMADSLQRGRSELERSNTELQRSNAELEQFASVTSHDLQAPLTTISMYAELLERRHGSETGEGHELIDGIRGATQQARVLIRDLLEYSRAGRGELAVEALHADVVLKQALEALAGAIETAGARVRVGPLPVVLADRTSLCRIFQNLVGNAVKFTRDDPQVSIEAEPDGAMWRFSIRDNGIGMQPEYTQHIFEPFRRLHGEEDYPGTGIGLAVCERIVEQHGGRIWVSSSPGEGSAFSFTMPAAEVRDDELAAAVQTPVGAGS